MFFTMSLGFFVCFTYFNCKWNHMVFIFLWLISLHTMPTRFIHVVVPGRISSFLWLNNILLSVCLHLPTCVQLLYMFTFSGHLGYFHIFILTQKFTCEQGLRKLSSSHQWIWLHSCTNTVCKLQMYWLQKQILRTESQDDVCDLEVREL